MAAILAIARLCEPSSELHIEEKWYRCTALEDLLGVPPEKVHTDRLYAALDRLLPHKEAIESHLKQRFGELFELKCDLLLYDVTSTSIEGDVENCEIAKRGYSRDSRGDRPQGCIGLVVTEEGFPLGYKGLRREHARFTAGEERRRVARAQARGVEPRLGHGPGDGQERQPRVPARARGEAHHRHTQGDAAAIRATPDGSELGRRPGGRRCEARAWSGWPGDVPPRAER